ARHAGLRRLIEPRFDLVPEIGRRVHRCRERRQWMQLLLPKRDGVAQRGIARERGLDLALLSGLEHTQDIFAGQSVQLFVVFGNHDSRQLRSASNPRRTQLLTLPSGAARRSAISAWE